MIGTIPIKNGDLEFYFHFLDYETSEPKVVMAVLLSRSEKKYSRSSYPDHKMMEVVAYNDALLLADYIAGVDWKNNPLGVSYDDRFHFMVESVNPNFLAKIPSPKNNESELNQLLSKTIKKGQFSLDDEPIYSKENGQLKVTTFFESIWGNRVVLEHFYYMDFFEPKLISHKIKEYK